MPLLPDKIEAFGFPISLVFDRSGKAYLSERISGILWKIEGDKFTAVRKFPILQALGHHEVGLLGITLDPDFDQNSYIYAYYTYGDTLENAANKVVRIKEGEEQEKIIIDNIPGGQIHNGGIIGFGPDKNLYICVGVDNAVMDKAQDIDYWGGKVLRVQPDGSIPKDNPYPNSPVFSFGHRNLFGIAFHPVTGLPFVSNPDRREMMRSILSERVETMVGQKLQAR
jgi:glucose/arabinose dehydrogenase